MQDMQKTIFFNFCYPMAQGHENFVADILVTSMVLVQ